MQLTLKLIALLMQLKNALIFISFSIYYCCSLLMEEYWKEDDTSVSIFLIIMYVSVNIIIFHNITVFTVLLIK